MKRLIGALYRRRRWPHGGYPPQRVKLSITPRADGGDFGQIRLVTFEGVGRREPMRPGSRAWDTGCYFSMMIRVKNMQSIYDDAIRLGWWTETPITALQFGESDLRVVIYRGPDACRFRLTNA